MIIDKTIAMIRLGALIRHTTNPNNIGPYEGPWAWQELMNFVESREGYIEGTKLAITKFEELIDHWRKTCDNQAKSIIENGVTLTSKQYLIDLLREEVIKAKKMIEGQDELIAQLNEDSDAQDKLVDRYEKALEVIDNALEKAATDEVEGEDPAVPFGISADGGGCRCSICDRGRWAKR